MSKKLEKLKERLDELQRERSKAEGAIEQLKSQLLEEFDCKTVKAAKRLLAQLEHEQQEAEEQFEADLTTFEKQHGNILGS